MRLTAGTWMFCVWGLTGLTGGLRAESIATIDQDVTTEFGRYVPTVVTVTPAVPPYAVPPDLSTVVNARDFVLPDGARQLLATNGFVAQASRFRQIHDLYNECEAASIPAFVTTDACLHTYHVLYDYMLRLLEVTRFMRDLDGMSAALRAAALQTYAEAVDAKVKEAALAVADYHAVALGLLHPEFSSITGQAPAEIGMILSGSDGYVPSPLLYSDDYPYLEDYSQYRPRGHYTRSQELERYFRAMMWYGRTAFSLDLLNASREGLRRAARQGLIVARAVAQAQVAAEPAAQVWERIYQPTVFFVGRADDVTFRDYLRVAEEVFGADFLALSPDVLADDARVDAFIDRTAAELPDPQIPAMAGKGLRLMGQRYIPDSYMLGRLVYAFVADRYMPRGLDVMAVLGSERAYALLDTLYRDTQCYGYPEQMDALRAEFAGLPATAWAQNLYYNWLYALLPLLEVRGQGWPPFMQSAAWVDKDLNAALGSWAELRHDTILYAKQSGTATVESPPAPRLARGYVEPNPEVYARLASLAAYMRTGLADRDLADLRIDTRLDSFERLMRSLLTISVKELSNAPLAGADYAVIANFGGTIEDLVTVPTDDGPSWQSEADQFTAVIADVHTDPNSSTCLEVGVGHPLEIHVIAPVAGVPTLTRGALFSYHEFARPLADGRLTDEEWQELQSGPNAEPMPAWTSSFVHGPSSLGQEVLPFYGTYEGQVTAVEEGAIPVAFDLSQNAPNPFNASTVIAFSVDQGAHVRLVVYDLAGQAVAVLADGYMAAGKHVLMWSPEELASGVYVACLATPTGTLAVKAVYLR